MISNLRKQTFCITQYLHFCLDGKYVHSCRLNMKQRLRKIKLFQKHDKLANLGNQVIHQTDQEGDTCTLHLQLGAWDLWGLRLQNGLHFDEHLNTTSAIVFLENFSFVDLIKVWKTECLPYWTVVRYWKLVCTYEYVWYREKRVYNLLSLSLIDGFNIYCFMLCHNSLIYNSAVLWRSPPSTTVRWAGFRALT